MACTWRVHGSRGTAARLPRQRSSGMACTWLTAAWPQRLLRQRSFRHGVRMAHGGTAAQAAEKTARKGSCCEACNSQEVSGNSAITNSLILAFSAALLMAVLCRERQYRCPPAPRIPAHEVYRPHLESGVALGTFVSAISGIQRMCHALYSDRNFFCMRLQVPDLLRARCRRLLGTLLRCPEYLQDD